MKICNKNNVILTFYQSLPRKLKNDFKYHLGSLLSMTPSTIYEKIKYNSFSAYERALVSYHLGIPQYILFPDLEEIVSVSHAYRLRPFYLDFFKEHGYEYDPVQLSQSLAVAQKSAQ